jgi:protein-disulfide isomerase
VITVCRARCLLAAVLMFAAVRAALAASECSDFPDSKQHELLKYIRGKYNVPASVDLALKGSDLVGRSCYRHLSIEGKSDFNAWSLDLYVSPDGRFVSTDLMDTTVDPKLEAITRDQQAMKALSAGNLPFRGSERAKVTIVEFSDFECPYCRSFSNLLSTELEQNPSSVRIVFRHFPLTSHSWARPAAEGAACAQLQGNGAFWKIHDQLFAAQSALTKDNIRTKLFEFAQLNRLDMGRFKECMDDQMSLGLVLKDIKAASLYQVTGTPTVFVNGERIQAVQDGEKLHQIIQEASNKADVDEAAIHSASSGPLVRSFSK